MAGVSRPVSDGAEDSKTTVIATPEGDNEMLPDEPLQPAADEAVTGLETPRGSEPDADRQEKR